MKDMRQLINLMEGVMAVPGIGQEADKDSAWSTYNTNHEQPTEEGVGCGMEEGASIDDDIVMQCMDRLSDMSNSFVNHDEAFNILQRELMDQGYDKDSIQSILSQAGELMKDPGEDLGGNSQMRDSEMDDLIDQGETFDEAFDEEVEEAFDFQNGYDDINDAHGDDYFPNGADSPVVKTVGPSGARQGDNPEQKKMQVAEVHKELVYGYRNYLIETAAVTKKKS